MSHPLDGPRLKVKRARSQLHAFEKKLGPLTGATRPLVRCVQSFNANDSAFEITIREARTIRIPAMLLLDEATHHLRSALDQLIFLLALADSGKEKGRTQFPLLSDPNSWDKGEDGDRTQNVWLEGICVEHKAAIELHQPYRPWTWKGVPYTHPLRVVNDLDNDEKHRIVQLGYPICIQIKADVPSSIGRNCVVDPLRLGDGPICPDVVGHPTKPNTPIARVPVTVTGPDPDLKVECEFQYVPGFRNGIAWEILKAAADYVTGVLDEFSPSLESPRVVALWDAVESRFKEPKKVEVTRSRSIKPVHKASDDLA